MKHIIALAIACLTFFKVQAQILPQGIAYQAVAVKEGSISLAGQNPQAIYWANKNIKVRFTIYDKYPNGSSQYSELYETTTDDYGVFNLIIGDGNVISGDFLKIPWELGTAHLQVEIDFDNNGTFKLTSLERFWSVPYAFVTKKSNSSGNDSALNSLNNSFNYLKNRDKDTVIGNEGGVSYKSLDSLNKVLLAKLAALKASDKDTIIGNEWQKLTKNKDTLILSDGGGKVALLDEDSSNELQKISRNGGLLILDQNGGTISLPDSSSNNELQTLSISNDTLSISNGNSIKLPNSSCCASGGANMLIFYTSDTFVVPSGVTSVIIEMWSGGNGGGQCSGSTGANGMYAKSPVTVVPGNKYSVVVGVGGNGGCPAGTGGTSSFNGIYVSRNASNAPFKCSPQNSVPYDCRFPPGITVGAGMGGNAFSCSGGCKGGDGLVVIYY
jgi:hypothetical protein